jgi:hypothetical protein
MPHQRTTNQFDLNEIGDALFFVIEGITGLFHDNQGKEVEIGELEVGELMGSMSFFNGKAPICPYSRHKQKHPFIAHL